jgi:hypothetical protein
MGYVQVGTTAHLALWQVPEDILVLRNTSHLPFQMHSAEFDREFLFARCSDGY